MAKPMTATQIVNQLKKWNVPFKEYQNWKTHNRNSKGAFSSVNGFMVHHTGSDNARQEALLYNGYSGLPGPLCQFGLDKDGIVWLIGWGRANHAGGGDPEVLKKVIAENYTGILKPTKGNSNGVDGNARYYGVEIYHSGKGTINAKQYESLRKLSAAVLDFHKWGDKSVLAHGEWSSDKWDLGDRNKMHNMEKVRADIRSTLSAGNAPTPPKPPVVPKPPVSPIPPSQGQKTHKVVKNDTLWSLHRAYNVSVDDLKKWNNLKSDTLTIGWVLNVSAPVETVRMVKVEGYMPRLSEGHSGKYVTILQENLNRFPGISVKVTGKYDADTVKAVVKFYKDALGHEVKNGGKVFGPEGGWRALLQMSREG